MRTLTRTLLVSVGSLALTAAAASAEVVCNNEGECWHVKRHDYSPELKLSIHPDTWKWGAHEKYRWCEHHGHGYWRKGVWIEIR